MQLFPRMTFGLQVYSYKLAEKYTQMAIKTGFRSFFASAMAGNQKALLRPGSGS